MSECCDTCRWGTEERTGNGPVEIGQRQITCRRLPPTPIALATPQGVQVLNAFPVLKPEGWCGEYAAKPGE